MIDTITDKRTTAEIPVRVGPYTLLLRRSGWLVLNFPAHRWMFSRLCDTRRYTASDLRCLLHATGLPAPPKLPLRP